MDLNRLAKVDLNLLVSLEALLATGSVSQAAGQLHLTQSALSKALARLRVLFDDPLLVRHGQGMRPTARAEALRAQLAELLPRLSQLLEPEGFDPANSERSFRLSVIDGAYTLFLHHWLPQLRAEAPGVRLECFPAQEDMLEALASGRQELAVTARDEPIAPLPPGFRSQLLMTDHYVCVSARDNPRLARPWDLAAFLDWPQVHIHCDWNGDWLLDVELARLGHRRQLMMQVASLQAALQSVLCSDLLTILPAAYAREVAQRYPIAQRELPLALPIGLPPLQQRLVWHQRSDGDPGLHWLIGFFQAAVPK
ncbi:LysR family transcriptional regulator [Gallaecimonas kandeliae]|uniref:LysR family transcriptional regulator n=1 Tax=Gallaecimonas kandeliae TaxID=3029055 RepID=UPI002649A7D3|nr:LysR family transcriptional regulator [Gallaecimonas kandeliae]WKE65945.1 LysR family transcriptional regulator [Gallaecimonas kandeliae]